MKILSTIFVILIGQFGMNMNEMVTGPAMAVQRNEVKRELKLTKEQTKAIDGVFRDLTNATRSRENANNPSAFLNALKTSNDRVWEILDDMQDARLRELILQMKGPTALLEEGTAKELALTDDQTLKLKELKSTAGKESLTAMQGGIEGQKKLKGILDKFDADALAVLSDEQRTKFTTMQGKAVKNLRIQLPLFG